MGPRAHALGDLERGEVVAGRVAAQEALGRVPAHHLRGAQRVQARGRAEVVEHLVIVDRAEERKAPLLLVEELGARVEPGGAGVEGVDRAPGGR